MLVILSGSSGVGKNTIINSILASDDRFELMPTMTTRQMRENEEEGKPYFFLSKADFEARIEAGEFAEYNLVHGNYYGTSKRVVEEKLAQDKILLKDIDVDGTKNLLQIFGDQIVSIYLKPPSREELVKRLTERGETEIEKRLARYDYEEKMSSIYKYVLVNDKMDDTISQIHRILRDEESSR